MVQCSNPSVSISCPDFSYSCDYNTYMQYHCVQTGSGGTGGATPGWDNTGASPTSAISTKGSTTPTPKPLNSLCQYSTECESGFCDTRGVAYNADTGTQYGYCHVLPTPTNTPTPTTAINCSSNSEVGMANTCTCTSSSSCTSGYCDPNSHKCATDPTCKSNGIKSYTYDKSGCFDSRTAKSISVVCNDGTTKVIPSSFQCTDTWRLDSSAVSFCSTHKTCPIPTATNTPTPTLISTPACDPDPTGASANKLDMADFVVWKTDFLDTGDTVKRSACLKPDSKIDLLDFQVWKNKSYGLL